MRKNEQASIHLQWKFDDNVKLLYHKETQFIEEYVDRQELSATKTSVLKNTFSVIKSDIVKMKWNDWKSMKSTTR